jgi:hypothetical protein
MAQRSFLDIKLPSQAEQKARQASAVKRHRQARENIEAVMHSKAVKTAQAAPLIAREEAEHSGVTRWVLRPGASEPRRETDEERRRDPVHFVVRPCFHCGSQRWGWRPGAELPTCLTCEPGA